MKGRGDYEELKHYKITYELSHYATVVNDNWAFKWEEPTQILSVSLANYQGKQVKLEDIRLSSLTLLFDATFFDSKAKNQLQIDLLMKNGTIENLIGEDNEEVSKEINHTKDKENYSVSFSYRDLSKIKGIKIND